MDTVTRAAPAFSITPLYQQIYNHLAEEIAAGIYPVGASLPNEVDLARSYKVSAGTMRKALDKLEAEGIVSRKQGRGTFVTATESHLCPTCGREMGNGTGGEQ